MLIQITLFNYNLIVVNCFGHIYTVVKNNFVIILRLNFILR